MHRIRLLASAGLAVAALSGGILVATPAFAKPAAEHKVTICHFTASETNPVVVITIDEHALEHHLSNHHPPVHQGQDRILLEGETVEDCFLGGPE